MDFGLFEKTEDFRFVNRSFQLPSSEQPGDGVEFFDRFHPPAHNSFLTYVTATRNGMRREIIIIRSSGNRQNVQVNEGVDGRDERKYRRLPPKTILASRFRRTVIGSRDPVAVMKCKIVRRIR